MNIDKKFEIKKWYNKLWGRDDKWYNFCKAKGIPYIVIESRVKYAKVSFDYITLPEKSDEILYNKGRDFFNSLKEIISKYATNKTRFEGNNLIFKYSYIPINKAPMLANSIFDFINNELKSCRQK